MVNFAKSSPPHAQHRYAPLGVTILNLNTLNSSIGYSRETYAVKLLVGLIDLNS